MKSLVVLIIIITAVLVTIVVAVGVYITALLDELGDWKMRAQRYEELWESEYYNNKLNK